jgi:hypothetical protein
MKIIEYEDEEKKRLHTKVIINKENERKDVLELL